MRGVITQPAALGPVINSGELTAMQEIQPAFDNVMPYSIHYPSNGTDDPSWMRRKNRIKQNIKLREKQD